MRNLQTIADNLDRAQRKFLAAAASIDDADWLQRPGADCWSAGEVLAHLIGVERTILKNADKLLKAPPRPRPLLKRIHFPMFLVEARFIRRKTPIAIQPDSLGQKEQMLAELRTTREQTRAFMEATKDRNLIAYHMPHPFLGTLNLLEWFQMIASHELRHTKQLREIGKFLQKAVENSHK